ncbi:unnamed protein product [Brassica oleracea var. botrytis]
MDLRCFIFVKFDLLIHKISYRFYLNKPHASHRVNKEAGHTAYKKDVETAIKHYSTAIEIYDEEISLITNRHAIHLKMESISFHIFFGVQFVNQDGDEAVAQEDEMVEEA